MKQCPRCSRTYTDEGLNFCLEDGEMLTAYFQPQQETRVGEPPPPTVMFDQVRVTNPTDWPQQPASAPPAQWQGQQAPQAQFARMGMAATPNQTLAVTSLGLGIASVTIGWCCSTGMLLSPAALITGFIALSQIKKDPGRFGGRGFAIGGIVAGIFYLSIFVLILIIYGAAIIGGGLSNIH